MTWRVIHGDCLEVLPTLDVSSIDAVVSDPPYGMDFPCKGNFSRDGVHVGGKDWGKRIEGDSEPFDPSPWLAFERVTLWGANHYAQRLPVGTTLVWLKRTIDAFGTFLSDAEIGWQKGGHGVYCHHATGGQARGSESPTGEALHPTQKPLSLMAWCIERLNLPEGATILDPYCGSGTTGVAATRLGFNFIGIEIDTEYARIARERISGDRPLFAGIES